MTETTASGAAQDGKGARKGLTIRRINTREGVHPYDEVTWERRDVVMTNWRDGSVNFEQKGVEFPDFWSVNAANIVTTKYFRGAVGTPQREWSLKQLVDRVVGTYVAAGREHGYFATEADAEIFSHELCLRADPPGLQLQLAGLVQRRDLVAAAGVGLPALRRAGQHPGRARCRSASWSRATRWAPRCTTPTARPGSSRSRPTASRTCCGCTPRAASRWTSPRITWSGARPTWSSASSPWPASSASATSCWT